MLPLTQWHTASPLWSEALENGTQARFRQPAILRFASDTFMADLQALLNKPEAETQDGLLNLVVRPETWRTKEADWLATEAFDHHPSLKLFQPAHGRFYLAAASLVCRIPGLPDRMVDTANEERVFFVLRKLVPNSNGETDQAGNENGFTEYGWRDGRWRQVSEPDRNIADDEERMPMFFADFTCDKRRRRLLGGFIPVANREAYQAAPGLAPAPPDGETPPDPRLWRFETLFVNPAIYLKDAIAPPDPDDEKAREAFIFALLDLDEFLTTYLHEGWPDEWTELDADRKAVFDWLHTTNAFTGVTWLEALEDVRGKRERILSGDLNSDVAPLEFIFDPINTEDIEHALATLGSPDAADTGSFYHQVREFIEQSPSPTLPEDLQALKALSQIDPRAGALYAIRCVYERPCCRTVQLATPLKARLEPKQTREHIVSKRSPAFQLASFFDPDAPARPLRITMPIDTSVDGLRKFPKNVTFLISNELRRQMERVQGLKLADLDDGNLQDDPGGLDFGMICSLSIPIITICALILLMIIVQLLNIVFWWLPFFKLCIPLNLKAKG